MLYTDNAGGIHDRIAAADGLGKAKQSKHRVVVTGNNVATSVTTAALELPTTANGDRPDEIRLCATQAVYVKFWNGGATGVAKLKALSAVVVVGGAGYVVNDTIDLAGGTSTTPATLVVDTVDGSGAVLTAHVSVGGSYSVLPSNPVAQDTSSGVGTLCTVTATWGVASITVTAAGSGLATAPAVVVSAGGGTGATATSTMAGGIVTALTVTAPGTGFTSVPTVAVGAAATAAVAGDMMLPAGVVEVLDTHGYTRLSVLRVSADGILNVTPVENFA